MSSTIHSAGRLCNQIIRNLCVSRVAEKNNLHVTYGCHDLIQRLGISLFSGQQQYGTVIHLTDDNYFAVLRGEPLLSNVFANGSFFQTKEISQFLWEYLRDHKQPIINANNFKERSNNNNDCFVHIRLGDTAHWNPGVEYYKKALAALTFDTLYIGTDSPDHPIIKELVAIYPSASILPYAEVETIQFGSTAKHIVLSHGSFSAVIGWLSFFSTVYYPEHKGVKWYGDMFSIPGWNRVLY